MCEGGESAGRNIGRRGAGGAEERACRREGGEGACGNFTERGSSAVSSGWASCTVL